MAQSSWPSPATGRSVDDFQHERLLLSVGPVAGMVGSFTNPNVVYGDSTGMQVKVKADQYALVRGYEWWSGASDLTVAISANASGATRLDLVVLRLTRATWTVTVEVRAGTPGGSAAAPVQNVGNSGVWDLPLAVVTVVSGASTISAGNVDYVAPHLSTDGRGYRVRAVSGLAYIPSPNTAMDVALLSGTVYRYDGGTGTWYVPYQAGTDLVSGSGAAFTKAALFPVPFPTGSAPVVTTNINSSAGAVTRCISQAYLVSATGFTFYIQRTDASDGPTTWTNMPVHWVAQLPT